MAYNTLDFHEDRQQYNNSSITSKEGDPTAKDRDGVEAARGTRAMFRGRGGAAMAAATRARGGSTGRDRGVGGHAICTARLKL